MADVATPVRGVLKIDVPTPAVFVELRFIRSNDGDVWDVDGVQAALAERSLREIIPREQIVEFLAKAGATKGEYAQRVVEGIAPFKPSPETVEWTDLTVPDELAATVARVLEVSAGPHITREVKQTVERQKEVTRKGKLPFGTAKTETITVKETEVTRERVYVEPTVREHAIVAVDDVLGTVSAANVGVPGRDVFGRPIPIKQLADNAFHTGAGIRRDGDSLIATTHGVLRIGRNWADVVPYRPHEWVVELSEDRATCFLALTPGHPEAPVPDAESIRARAVDIPYPGESLVGVDEIAALIARAIESREAIREPITLSRDASFDLVVSDDRMSAMLYIHKGKGRGKALSLREVGTAIKESGLKGLDLERIRTDINEFYRSDEQDLTGYVLSEGQPPTPGADRGVEYAVEFFSDREFATQQKRLAENSDAAEEYASLEAFPASAVQKMASVQGEQLICTLDPETPGEAGRDVFGQVVPPPPGALPEIVLHEHVQRKNLVLVTLAPGVLDWAIIDGAHHLRVRSQIDARVAVEISDDRMEARVAMSDGAGSGLRITADVVRDALLAAGVRHGIRDEVIDKGVAAAQAGTQVTGIVVAQGTEPVHQSENQIEYAVDLVRKGGVRIRKDGTADYRSQDQIVTVSDGDLICTILPAQQVPQDGIDVTGQPIPARQQSGAGIVAGPNIIQQDREDGSILMRAEIAGEVVLQKGVLEVRAGHSVTGDVDMKVGNIKFPGSVSVQGSVRSGFYVVSGGDIRIAGGVEAALLSADGDIIIGQGVKGAGKAVLRSKKNVMSPFVELATVLSVGDLVLKSAVVRSRIKCNGKLAFQGDKGRIVGGTIRTRHGLEVAIVGSPRGVRTQVSFGQDYLIQDLIEKEEQEIDRIKRRITVVDQEMRKSERAKKSDALETLRKDKVKLLKLLEKRGLRLFTLRERFEQHFPSRIIVTGAVHTGTIFESHGRTLEITRPRKNILVEFNPQTGNLDVRDNKEE